MEGEKGVRKIKMKIMTGRDGAGQGKSGSNQKKCRLDPSLGSLSPNKDERSRRRSSGDAAPADSLPALSWKDKAWIGLAIAFLVALFALVLIFGIL
jgi:hypothetical protein